MKKKNIINILISGLGGQGVAKAGEIVTEAFVKGGFDVKMSAAYGLCRRGAPITSHIRIGKKIYSPLVPKKGADILIAMELSESSKWLEYLKEDGLIISFDRQILSGMALSGTHSSFKEKIKTRYKRWLEISYDETAGNLKNINTINIFILGALSCFLPMNKEYWLKAIRVKFSVSMRSSNLFAFELGRKRFTRYEI